MRAAAKFVRNASTLIGNLDRANLIAIFLTKQRHSAIGFGFVEGLHALADREFLSDVAVNQGFNLEQLLAVEGAREVEVETHAFGVHR